MRNKTLSLIFITLIAVIGLGTIFSLFLAAGAGSLFMIASSSGEQPEPIENAIPQTGYQAVDVDHVEVEVGVGSPNPVHVIISGNLPDTCAQIELVEQQQAGSDFRIRLSTIPSDADECIQNSLPFRISLPLNVVNLPAGSYSVEVNGSHADFELATANTTSSLPTVDSALIKDDIQVDDVNVEIGLGSPQPVHAIVSLNLPNTCAQLGEMRLHRAESTFYIQLISYTLARADCQVDIIPFRAEIPLNIVNLPEGPYEVIVNGATASFDPRAVPAGNSDGSACTDPVDVPVENGQVAYNGISFQLDAALGDSLSAITCPAVSYQENQAPGEAHPPFVAFTFSTYDRPNSDTQPELRVYEVSGDMTQYLYPLNNLDELQNVIRQQPQPVSWFNDAPLHTQQATLNFNNGSGVRGLIQYMQNYFFYTNNGLLYEFNGLTQDGRYVVIFRHPLSVPFLMELDGPTLPPQNLNAQAISIPAWPDDFDQQLEVIKTYNSEALARFEQMSESEAFPDITLLDSLVKSLHVSQP
jgi:hypothetical protein